MSLLASEGATPKSSTSNIVRPIANFPPTIWGDYFIAYSTKNSLFDSNLEKQIEELKAKVKGKLVAATTDADRPSNKTLDIVDAIQRLGLAYQFEIEIEEALQVVYNTHDNAKTKDDHSNDLYHTALRFRLLRQQGYHISCNVLNKFKDNKGNFKESLVDDVFGMLSLYEAAHLRIHGDDILDEALSFTVSHLESMATQLSPPLATQVVQALNQPIRRGVPRLEARKYIAIYQDNDSHDPDILKLAKLDFNRVQEMHQKELAEISIWWKDLDVKTKLPYARDRIAELYFWIMAAYFEPHYALARRFTTKVMAMSSLIDDTYDAYGTLDELQLFTEAVERWDIGFINHLPENMKVIYQALLDTYMEIKEETAKEGRSFCVSYAIEELKQLCRSYFLEAKWFNKCYVPTIQEYMPLALVSCGYKMIATTSFIGMGDIANKEAFDWVTNNPKIIRASTIVCRLMDDITSHRFEQERGHVASAIECYMKRHHASSEEEVIALLRKQVEDAWKDINEEYLKPTAVPVALLDRVLNFASAMNVLHKDNDCYTNAHLIKDEIAALFRDPIPI